MKIDKEVNKFDSEIKQFTTSKHIPKPRPPKKTPEELKKYNRQYYQDNKERFLLNAKNYRERHRAEYNAYHRQYNKESKEYKEYQKNYRKKSTFKKNKEIIKAYHNNYRKENKRILEVSNRLYYLKHRNTLLKRANFRHKIKKIFNDIITNDNGIVKNQVSKDVRMS